ncbi:hypothetical protein [Nonomuraea sp. NPDC049725]|uniref:hypothetical protein n=1 Tax=Nonomuraea sp. NPDC049725 TaxID=3154508 RepID=UPI00343F6138
MSDDATRTAYERELAQVIGGAARRAPRAPGGYAAQVLTRSRRRRARTQAILAAVAVVVVAGGGGIGLREALGADPPVAAGPAREATPSPAMTLPAMPAVPDPVAQVWPEAVHTIPAKLPDGRRGRPLTLLDEHTVLLETWESFEKADAVHTYDLRTGRTRKVTDIRTPKGVFASGFAVGEGKLVWQTIDKMRTSFWSVPLSGGKPTAVKTDTPVEGRGDKLVVTGGKIAFSLHEGGVFTLPLEGGAVTPVEGAGRHHILKWPWVGTPGAYTPDNEPSFERILNVETGQTSQALVRPGEEDIRCGVTACVGRGPGRKPFYRLRDGSGERALPDSTPGLAHDRFMTAQVRPGVQALLDLTTGRSGDLGVRPDAEGRQVSVQPGLDPYDRLIAYELKNEYVLIDLARIR